MEITVFNTNTTIVEAITKLGMAVSFSESRRHIHLDRVKLDGKPIKDITQKLSLWDSGKFLTVGSQSFRIMVIEG